MRRMASSSDSRKKSRKGRSAGRIRESDSSPTNPIPASPDLMTIMERFSQALSLVVVCHRSLAAQPSAGVGDEEETLRRAIRLLKDVYNDIDLASMAMREKSL
jgi:hypothetical protein